MLSRAFDRIYMDCLHAERALGSSEFTELAKALGETISPGIGGELRKVGSASKRLADAPRGPLLSARSRQSRRMMLASSALLALLGVMGGVPEKLELLGVDVSGSNASTLLLAIVAAAVGYGTMFFVSVRSDLAAHRDAIREPQGMYQDAVFALEESVDRCDTFMARADAVLGRAPEKREQLTSWWNLVGRPLLQRMTDSGRVAVTEANARLRRDPGTTADRIEIWGPALIFTLGMIAGTWLLVEDAVAGWLVGRLS